MKKILTKEKQAKKVRQNQLIIGVVLILLMVFSTVGYALTGNDDEKEVQEIEYKGIKFVQESSEYWKFNIQGYDFLTKYNPKETEDILFFDYSSINDYVNKPIYFVSEFSEPNFEISRNLNSFVLRFNEACLSEDCEKDFPVKNCSIDNIIIIKELEEGESGNIYQEENCVFITADISNQTRYADAFLFKIFGI